MVKAMSSGVDDEDRQSTGHEYLSDLFSLEGKVALVTGGAGKYGWQIVRALVRAGAETWLTSSRAEALQPIENDFRAEGMCVTAACMDQGDEDSVLALRDRVMESSGGVDILVNNAVARTMVNWDDDTTRFDRSMRVNATGLYSVIKVFGHVMAGRGGGSIINIASIQGMVGADASLYEGLGFHGFMPDYFFHKGGMLNFTRFAASYFGPRNVRCNCISPGGLGTEATPAEFVRRYSRRTMLGRMAGAGDLAGAIVFLASDASAYVTGVNIPVDGGYVAK